MVIANIYSKRQKKLNGDTPDVYQYDKIPSELRVQICYIIARTIGPDKINTPSRGVYLYIIETLREEYGVITLSYKNKLFSDSPQGELFNFFTDEQNIDRCLDVVELSFQAINLFTRRKGYLSRSRASQFSINAISELNERFKEHGVGYQFINGEIIRIDSEFIHAEAVKPALALLSNKTYQGAQDEFLLAHEHYRHGNAKGALNECLKAFESTLKIICDKRDWDYPAGSTAKNLIKICFDNNLIPAFWQDHYNCLQKILENGVPTGRNKLSGHGQGSEIINIPNSIVAYMLHMTASAIVFLAESEAALA